MLQYYQDLQFMAETNHKHTTKSCNYYLSIIYICFLILGAMKIPDLDFLRNFGFHAFFVQFKFLVFSFSPFSFEPKIKLIKVTQYKF